MNLDVQFMEEISKCKEPQLFIGVARILKVQLLTEEKDEEGHFIPRPFEQLFADVMAAYHDSLRKRKRELLKILREANKTTD